MDERLDPTESILMPRSDVGHSFYSSESLIRVTKEQVDAAANAIHGHASTLVRDLVSGEEKLQNEISNHYLEGLKYGMAQSDGSISSNYWRYMTNRHVLGLCCASRQNPINKRNNLCLMWNSLSLTFLLSSIFYALPKTNSFIRGGIIAVIMGPYSALMYSVAACQPFHRHNRCVRSAHQCGCAMLALFSALGALFVAAAVIIIVHSGEDIVIVATTFLISMLFEQLMPFYLGVFNWIFVSWKGFLCCPQCACACLGLRCKSTRFMPLLGLWPIRLVLNAYYLGESTYEEDKEIFKQKYPGRIAIDDVSREAPVDNSLLTSSSFAANSRTSAITV